MKLYLDKKKKLLKWISWSDGQNIQRWIQKKTLEKCCLKPDANHRE